MLGLAAAVIRSGEDRRVLQDSLAAALWIKTGSAALQRVSA
jgi:hypothetical protein